MNWPRCARRSPARGLHALWHRSPAVPVDADIQGRQEQGRPRRLAGALDRCHSRALRDLPGGGELGARPFDARVHGAARPAGVHAGREREHLGAGHRADDRRHAPARRQRALSDAARSLAAARQGTPAVAARRERSGIEHPGREQRGERRRPRQRPSGGRSPTPAAESSGSPATVQVAKGDTLTKIARSLHADTQANIDQTMIALYRANPEAFGGNINILRRGAVLRVPGADEIAALNQNEAMSEVHRQMDAWRSAGGAAAPSGHLRLVTPSAGGSGTESAARRAGSRVDRVDAETQALKDRVKDLEGQLADSQRLIDIRNQRTQRAAAQARLRRQRLRRRAPRRRRSRLRRRRPRRRKSRRPRRNRRPLRARLHRPRRRPRQPTRFRSPRRALRRRRLRRSR